MECLSADWVCCERWFVSVSFVNARPRVGGMDDNN